MQRIARVAVTLLTFTSSLSYAAGLRVPIDNGLGTPGVASGPALAEDASTGMTNPAGLLRIDHPELVVAVNPAFTSTEFKGDVNVVPMAGIPIETNYSGTADARLNVPLIAIHFSYPLKEWLIYGFSLTNPFGQSVHYDDNSIVGSTVTEGMLITWDISNAFAFRITDDFSLGAGIDAIRLDFAADNIYPITIDTGSIYKELLGVYTHNTASGWSMSWHAGALYQFNNKHSRVGFNYRPPVSMNGTGRSYSNLNTEGIGTGSGGGTIENKDFSIEFDLPPIYSLSVYHQVFPRLDIALSTEFAQWTYFDYISFKNVVNTDDFKVAEKYKNVWGFGAALFYQWTQQFRTSAGLKYDNSPLNPKYVNVDFPESDVWVAGISGAYQFNKVVRLEVGYSHSFFSDVAIDHYDPVSGVTNTGTGRLHADIINTQLTINLAPVVKAFNNFNEYTPPPGKPEWPNDANTSSKKSSSSTKAPSQPQT